MRFRRRVCVRVGAKSTILVFFFPVNVNVMFELLLLLVPSGTISIRVRWFMCVDGSGWYSFSYSSSIIVVLHIQDENIIGQRNKRDIGSTCTPYCHRTVGCSLGLRSKKPTWRRGTSTRPRETNMYVQGMSRVAYI